MEKKRPFESPRKKHSSNT